MSETSQLSWSCPACGRRVPLRVDRCHCGRLRDATRPEPRAPLARSARAASSGRQTARLWRSLPLDVKALVVVAVLVVGGGVGWALFGPQQNERMPALLGYLEPTPPPTTQHPAARPPFKLPWWR